MNGVAGPIDAEMDIEEAIECGERKPSGWPTASQIAFAEKWLKARGIEPDLAPHGDGTRHLRHDWHFYSDIAGPGPHSVPDAIYLQPTMGGWHQTANVAVAMLALALDDCRKAVSLNK